MLFESLAAVSFSGARHTYSGILAWKVCFSHLRLCSVPLSHSPLWYGDLHTNTSRILGRGEVATLLDLIKFSSWPHPKGRLHNVAGQRVTWRRVTTGHMTLGYGAELSVFFFPCEALRSPRLFHAVFALDIFMCFCIRFQVILVLIYVDKTGRSPVSETRRLRK